MKLTYLGSNEQIQKLKNQEATNIVKELIEYEARQEIVNYPSYAEYAPWGDTYVESGREYKDEDIEECKEIAKERILEEFKSDPPEFLENYNLSEFTEENILNIINLI